MEISSRLAKVSTAMLAVLLLAGCGGQVEEAPQESLNSVIPGAKDYNVLVVSFDAMRADALGIYGYGRDTSPNIDAFGRNSIVFENAYTSAPVTPTSFAAAITGQHPFRVFVGWQLLPTVTLASVMKNGGYGTFAVFGNVQLVAERDFDQGFDSFFANTISDETILRDAKLRLEEFSDQKFFGWVHFISPHTPYEYRELSAHLAGPQETGRFAKTTGGKFEVETDEELQRARDLYDGEVFYADDLFGQLMGFLEDNGLMDNTIVVLTTDHGEEFMEHGQLQHNSLYEEVIRIPMILYHPDLEAGMRTPIPYSHVDLMPTLASMVGVELPAAVDGLDLFRAADLSRHRVVTAMTNKERFEILVEREGQKLIQLCTPEFTEELYDLRIDPKEQNNLILDRPELAGELFATLQETTMGEPCQVIMDSNRGKTPQQLLNAEQIEKLRSLGYIQ